MVLPSSTSRRAFVRLACMTKPFIHLRMTDIRHPPTHPPDISSLYLLLKHLIKTRPFHAGHYFIRLSGPMMQYSELTRRSKPLTVTAPGFVRGIGVLLLVISLVHMSKSHRIWQLVSTDTCMPESWMHQLDEVATFMDPLTYRISLFTLWDGTLPVHSVSTYILSKYILSFVVTRTDHFI
jgi:hypothetical protein